MRIEGVGDRYLRSLARRRLGRHFGVGQRGTPRKGSLRYSSGWLRRLYLIELQGGEEEQLAWLERRLWVKAKYGISHLTQKMKMTTTIKTLLLQEGKKENQTMGKANSHDRMDLLDARIRGPFLMLNDIRLRNRRPDHLNSSNKVLEHQRRLLE